MQHDLNSLQNHEFFWMGRFVVFKMMALPQLLYLFRTLSISLPNSYFNSLQSLLSAFIWYNKKPWCAYQIPIKHRSVEGSGYVYFKDYYTATLLLQLGDCFWPSISTRWGQIEFTYVPGQKLKLWLLGTPHALHYQQLFHLLCKPQCLPGGDYPRFNAPISLNIPLGVLTLLIPNLSLQLW